MENDSSGKNSTKNFLLYFVGIFIYEKLFLCPLWVDSSQFSLISLFFPARGRFRPVADYVLLFRLNSGNDIFKESVPFCAAPAFQLLDFIK